MVVICNDNRFEIIEKAKKHLLEATNIDTSPDEMKVLDNFLFRCWQMGWLDRYDRKDEPNSSEKPNNCDTCRHYKLACELFSEVCKYEPTTQTETQNSNLTFEKRTMRDCYNCKRFETEDECIECHYEPKDEPQTDEHCETCRHKDECEGATYEYKNTEWWCLAYAPIDEPQTDCPWK